MTDIYELRKAKGDMAVAIQRIIREFEKNTGAQLESVTIKHATSVDVTAKGQPVSVIASIDVKVTI